METRSYASFVFDAHMTLNPSLQKTFTWLALYGGNHCSLKAGQHRALFSIKSAHRAPLHQAPK